jgi:hypothetical protein
MTKGFIFEIICWLNIVFSLKLFHIASTGRFFVAANKHFSFLFHLLKILIHHSINVNNVFEIIIKCEVYLDHLKKKHRNESEQNFLGNFTKKVQL